MKSIAHRLATLRGVFSVPCLVSLHAGDPEAGNEVSYPNYAPVPTRFEVREELVDASNAERIIFAECENADVIVTHLGIRKVGDATLSYYDPLPQPVRIGHLIRPEIPIGAITIKEL